jgi:DNA invertase Pin-like site-specific DNA recombinase
VPACSRRRHDGLLIGYARVSTDAQDLTAQREGLLALGVDPGRLYVDRDQPRTPGAAGGAGRLSGGRHPDPVGRLLFNLLAMVAEFESDLICLRTKEGMRVAKAKGGLRGEQPKLNPQEAH